MEKQYFISLYLDKRRKKSNGKFPVKLRVFTPAPRTQKLYPTTFEFTPSEFQSIWETLKPRIEHKDIRRVLQAVVSKAEDAANSLQAFSFRDFEKLLYRNKGEGSNVFWHYEQAIEAFKANNQIGNANNYELSLKSIKGFIAYTKGVEPTKLLFSEVTANWLNRYENFMLNEKQRTSTTVSIYVRVLRTIFNNAIKQRDITKDIYPFGEDGYQVPAVKRVKKALSAGQLKQLFEAKPRTPEQQKAKDFWFFSYSCNGMNIKDIAGLRYENLNDNTLRFIRAKTIRTTKDNQRENIVYLNDFTKAVIEKYSTPNKHPKQFIFSIIDEKLSEVEKHIKIKNFTRFINQNLKKLAIAQGITADISTYWARHSFATNSIRKGASMEYVSEALSHSNLNTTKGYFAGFEDETKREFAESLMNF